MEVGQEVETDGNGKQVVTQENWQTEDPKRLKGSNIELKRQKTA